MTRLNMHPEDKKAMLQRYMAEGLNQRQIAQSLQVHRSTVGVWLRQLGLKKQYDEMHCKNIETHREKLTSLIETGMNKPAIAREMHVSRSTIDDWCEKLGLNELYRDKQADILWSFPPCPNCGGRSTKDGTYTSRSEEFITQYYKCTQCYLRFCVGDMRRKRR